MENKHLIPALVAILISIAMYIPISESQEVCGPSGIQITLSGPCEKASRVMWEVKRFGESSFKDYSEICMEGNSEIKLGDGEKKAVTCTTPITLPDSERIPFKKSGPHTVRVSWCGASIEFQYGGPCDYSNRRDCEETKITKGKCWWDDGANDCKGCVLEAIEKCSDYPTRVWGMTDGACPVCIRNPCMAVKEGPCYLKGVGFLTVCKSCDDMDECYDYGIASSCDCDPCGVGEQGGHKCDWGAGPTVDKYITIKLLPGYGVATGGTMDLKCGDVAVPGEVISVSGETVQFRITKENQEKIFDAGCWYS